MLAFGKRSGARASNVGVANGGNGREPRPIGPVGEAGRVKILRRRGRRRVYASHPCLP